MVDRNRLLDELRTLKQQIKSNPKVLAKYDLDGNGEISGEEWDLARKAITTALEAEEAGQKQKNGSQLDPAGAASFSAAAAGSAAAQVFNRLHDSLSSEDASPEGTLLTHKQVIVQQQVESVELIRNLEGRNRYKFLTASGQELAHAEENDTGIAGAISRNLLGNRRMFNLGISVHNTNEVISVKRQFELILSKIKVTDNKGPVGEVKQQFSLLSRKYELIPYFGMRRLIISGPLLKPWTFNILAGSRQVGSIKKKWSGVFKETFTKADSFEVSLDDPGLKAAERKLIFAAAIAIDIDYFEQKSN